MGKVMRHTLGASLNIRHSLSSSKGPKPLQLKLLTTYIPKTSAFTLAFSTSQRLRTTRASARTFFTFRHYITPSARDRQSGSAGMPRPISYAVLCLKKKKVVVAALPRPHNTYTSPRSAQLLFARLVSSPRLYPTSSLSASTPPPLLASYPPSPRLRRS